MLSLSSSNARSLTLPEQTGSENLCKFRRNEHGHVVLTITGNDMTGAKELEALKLKIPLDQIYGNMLCCLASNKEDSYDSKHRLDCGSKYNIVLIPGEQVGDGNHRSSEKVCDYAREFGYKIPLAGIIPRIRELVTDDQMKDMGFFYIAGLHQPITNAERLPCVLRAIRNCRNHQWLEFRIDRACDRWVGLGAFAFLSGPKPDI